MLLTTFAKSLLTPSNPGYLCVIARPIATINMAANNSTITLSQSANQGQWLLNFNFSTHPELINSKYVSSLTYTDVAPDDNTLVVGSSSLYNDKVGVVLLGGVTGVTYSITVGVTLSSGNVLSYTQNLQLGA